MIDGRKEQRTSISCDSHDTVDRNRNPLFNFTQNCNGRVAGFDDVGGVVQVEIALAYTRTPYQHQTKERTTREHRHNDTHRTWPL